MNGYISKFAKLDLSNKPELQNIVNSAAKLCQKPFAVIGILDDEFNWFKVKTGVEVNVMPRATSFCQHTVKQNGLLIIADTLADDRFKDSPLVKNGPKIRFYAGAPLVLPDGVAIGSLCLFDQNPGSLNELQQELLVLLSKQALSLMELELSKSELKNQIEAKEAINGSLMRIAQLQSHQIRQPLTSIMGLANLINEGLQPVDEAWLNLFSKATKNFDKVIQQIVAETMSEKDLKAIRFNKMVEEIDDYAILLINIKGYVENWNRGAKKIKGYDADEIIGKHFSVFYTPEDQAANRPEKLLNIARKKGVARDEGWRVRKNGTTFWGSVVITAITGTDNAVIGFTKVTRDLTDITSTRASLQASERMYNHLLEQTSKIARIGGWELDLVTQNLEWTPVTREIHEVAADYRPDLNTAINFYKKGVSRNKITEAIKLAVNQGTDWDLELKLVTATGRELWVRAIGNSNFKDGVCTKLYGTFQDIDDLKRKSYRKKNQGQAGIVI